jgi:hypothetical protein
MAEQMQLDKAADLIGKSEVTLRRLVKAGRIPYVRQKTLTGFIYLVNPDDIRNYYQQRGVIVGQTAEGEAEGSEEELPRPAPSGPVRVAVASESGNAIDYWQKKAENYEEKYYKELASHSQTREELGTWRGRAEQAQAMVLKLLPAPQEVSVENRQGQERQANTSNGWVIGLVVGLILVFLIGGSGVIYLLLRK